MKEKVTVSTRKEYYVANIAGMLFLVFLIGLSLYNSIHNGTVNFRSIILWAGVVAFLALPFAIISFFSSIKTVVIADKVMVISYVFQKHRNNITLTEIAGFQGKVVRQDTTAKPAPFTDSFSFSLRDGRSFSFTRSQFDHYHKLKAVVYKAYVGNQRK